jgi:hypothetical protein
MARRIRSQATPVGEPPPTAVSRFFFDRGRLRLEPTAGGVVVVRAGADHAVFGHMDHRVFVGCRIAAESELQHAHAREALPLYQPAVLGGDRPQVFGDQRQAGQALPEFCEKILGRRRNPAAADRRSSAGGNLPVSHEPPKMVDAQKVE